MGVAESPPPFAAVAQTKHDQLRVPEARSAACLNCGTTLAGPYCSACGQRDIPPYPSVRELVVDAFWELSGWDGRFANTVRELFRHPGKLTREFLEGRRARYLSPLRLYLMASLLYFLVAAAAPAPKVVQFVTVNDRGARVTATAATSAPERVGNALTDAVQTQQAPTAAKRDAALRDIARAPKILQPFVRRLILDPAGFKRGMVDAMPRVLFVLVPVFAAILMPFYRGRKYPEHLYFSIHLHSFVFLALLVNVIARFTRLAPLVNLSGVAVLGWMLAYTTIALRRNYGGSIAKTLVKEAAIGTLYVCSSTIALFATIYWVAVWA